jgi:hypothetical protein
MRMEQGERSRSEGGSEPFDACLSRLLELKRSSARTLAEKLEVDVSLVHKWMRGERTPRFGSRHVERIGEALGLDAVERAQLVLSHTSTLRAAQTRSRTQDRPKKSVPKRVATLIARIVGQREESVIAETASGRGTQPPQLPKEGAIVEPQTVYEAVIDFIGSVPRTRTADRAIFMTFHSEGISEGIGAGDADDSDHGAQWQQAVREALRRGWRVEHVWRLTRDARRTAFLVATTLDLLGAGDYQPLYTSGAAAPSPPYDLVIRPDAALLLLATRNARNVDGGILTRDPKQIQLLSGHYAQLRAQAKPLLQSYRRDNPQFGAVVVESETRFPGRSLVKYGLSFYTEPEEWSHPASRWAQRMTYPEADVESFSLHRWARLAAFRDHVRTHLYRDICPKRAIERLAQEGRYSRYTERHAGTMGKGKSGKMGKQEPQEVASVEERRQHLHSAIALLEAHDNFQIALLDADEEKALGVQMGTYWEVVGADRVLINARTLDAHAEPMDIEIAIDEPTTVAGCLAHFDQLWERIMPRNRDKDYVIWWLERQLESVPV